MVKLTVGMTIVVGGTVWFPVAVGVIITVTAGGAGPFGAEVGAIGMPGGRLSVRPGFLGM